MSVAHPKEFRCSAYMLLHLCKDIPAFFLSWKEIRQVLICQDYSWLTQDCQAPVDNKNNNNNNNNNYKN